MLLTGNTNDFKDLILEDYKSKSMTSATKSFFNKNIKGTMAENLYLRYLGLQKSLISGKDPGWDFEFNNVKYDVKEPMQLKSPYSYNGKIYDYTNFIFFKLNWNKETKTYDMPKTDIFVSYNVINENIYENITREQFLSNKEGINLTVSYNFNIMAKLYDKIQIWSNEHFCWKHSSIGFLINKSNYWGKQITKNNILY